MKDISGRHAIEMSHFGRSSALLACIFPRSTVQIIMPFKVLSFVLDYHFGWCSKYCKNVSLPLPILLAVACFCKSCGLGDNRVTAKEGLVGVPRRARPIDEEGKLEFGLPMGGSGLFLPCALLCISLRPTPLPALPPPYAHWPSVQPSLRTSFPPANCTL